jgi:hypothetical protein
MIKDRIVSKRIDENEFVSQMIGVQFAASFERGGLAERQREAIRRARICIDAPIPANVVGESILEQAVLLRNALDLLLKLKSVELLLFQHVVLHLPVFQLAGQLVDDLGRLKGKRGEGLRVI